MYARSAASGNCMRVEYIHVRKAGLGDLFLQSADTGMGDNRASAAVGHIQFGLPISPTLNCLLLDSQAAEGSGSQAHALAAAYHKLF